MKINCVNCKYFDFNDVDGVDWCRLNHYETGVCGYCDREFEDLEEATIHYDDLVEENNAFLMNNSKMAGEIEDLKTKLAEKDKEVERIKANQSKISFAISELVDLKKFIEKEIKICNKLLNEEFEDDYYIQSVGARQSMCYEFRGEIDNRIKELKRRCER